MHISEGVLPASTLLAGAALAGAGVAFGLSRLDYDDVPRAGLLSAAFYVASLIHVNWGGVSFHLVLNGLLGVLLGWVAFPAILLGLLLQSVFFQEGGLSALGVNTVVMAAPAVLGYHLFGRWVRRGGSRAALAAAFACGLFAVLSSGILAGVALLTVGESFRAIAYAVVGLHAPLAVVEGMVTAFCVSFLQRVRPEVLNHGWTSSSTKGADR